jgi:hypothetical protein
MKAYSVNLKPKPANKLKNLRAYLCGCMDRAADGGVGWRRMMANHLLNMGVTVLDPSNKPIDMGIEDLENRELRSDWKKEGKYDQISKSMRIIRNTDLRMVDLSDFLIVSLDLDSHPCGTYEELFLANRQKKPIILRIPQGKENTPDWLLGTIPHETIFSNWNQVKSYLRTINEGRIKIDSRWMFFSL